MSIEILDDIIRLKQHGIARAIPSICSAHPFVLKAVMERAARQGTAVLVESTCNQVNQFGGYTGLTPRGFCRLCAGNRPTSRVALGTPLARRRSFGTERLARRACRKRHGQVRRDGKSIYQSRVHQNPSRCQHEIGG